MWASYLLGLEAASDPQAELLANGMDPSLVRQVEELVVLGEPERVRLFLVDLVPVLHDGSQVDVELEEEHSGGLADHTVIGEAEACASGASVPCAAQAALLFWRRDLTETEVLEVDDERAWRRGCLRVSEAGHPHLAHLCADLELLAKLKMK